MQEVRDEGWKGFPHVLAQQLQQRPRGMKEPMWGFGHSWVWPEGGVRRRLQTQLECLE